MQTSQFKIYAPLQNFFWRGTDFELAPDFWIKHFNQNQKPNLSGLDDHLTENEKTDINTDASHWLTFHWNEGTEPCPAETVNLVLISLWLVKPTASNVAFRFQLGQGEAADQKSVHRLHDRFAWLSDDAHNRFDDSNLQSVSYYYHALFDICSARGRLNDALILTMTGCFSRQWQAALICHAAATEALLTYSTGRGITRRLATSYACLVETQKSSRDAAYNEFCTLYSIRSDIMHGRPHNVASSERLPLLARFQAVLRRLWSTVLSSPQRISILEGSDAQRDKYLSQLASGYSPPNRNP